MRALKRCSRSSKAIARRLRRCEEPIDHKACNRWKGTFDHWAYHDNFDVFLTSAELVTEKLVTEKLVTKDSERFRVILAVYL